MIHPFDLLIFIILAVGAINGFRKGAIYQTCSLITYLLTIIGGIKLANYLYQSHQDYISFIPSPLRLPSLIVLSYILIFLAGHLIGWLLTTFISISGLSLINKLIGAPLGIIKYFLIWSCLMYSLLRLNDYFNIFSHYYINQSTLFNMLTASGKMIIDLLIS